MPHVKRQKIQLKSQVILTALLLVAGLFVISNNAQAAVGLHVGTSTLILNSGENLMFGNINAASNAASNLLLLQNASLPKFIITSVGNVGVGISNPNDIFSIGNSGSAPAGSSNTGHNYTNTYLSSDDYALANYGIVKTLIASATSSSALWGGALGGSIWNLNSTNVGIGTTTPNAKLHIVGTTSVYPLFVQYHSMTEGIPAMPDYLTSVFIRNISSAYANEVTYIGGSGAWTGLNFGDKDSYNIGSILYYNTDNSLRFSVNSSESLRINSSGNIGIGTTTPLFKLDVRGGDINIDSGRYYRTNTNAILGQSSGDFNFGYISGNSYATFDTLNNFGIKLSNVNRFYINSSGNVGIGTTSPVAKLHLVTTSGGQFPLIAEITGTGANRFVIYPWTDGNTYLQHNGKVIFSPVSSVNGQLTIDTSGNVGIGMTTPNDIFSIGNSGSAPAGSSNTGHNYTNTYLSSDDYALANYGLVKTLISAATSSSALWGGTLGGSIWSLNSTNVGIGTTTPIYKLDVNGDVRTGEQTISSTNYLKNSYIASFNTAGNRKNIVIPFGTIDWHRATLKLLITSTDGSVSPHGRIEVVYNIIVYNNGGALSFYKNDVQTNEAFGGLTGLLYIQTPEISGTDVFIPLVWKMTQSRSIKVTLEAWGSNSDIPYLRNTYIGSEYNNSDSATGMQSVNFIGNVGVGTTTPAYKLDVVGDMQVTTAGGAAFRVNTNSGLNFYSYLQPFIFQSNYTGPGLFSFRYGNTDRMTILQNGNVGIGTTGPGYPLHVVSNTAGNINLGVQNTSTTGYEGFNYINESGVLVSSFAHSNASAGVLANSTWLGSRNAESLHFVTNGTAPRMTINSTGNVGINTTAPNDIFSIGNAGSAPAGSSNTGHNYTNTYLSSDDYALANYGIVKTLIASATSSSALWGGSVSGNIWSLNSSNVGIGTSTPSKKLEVAGGTILVSSGGTALNPAIAVGNYSNGMSMPTTNDLVLSSAGVERIRFASTGNIGIGITNPLSILDVVSTGKFTASSTGASIKITPTSSLAADEYGSALVLNVRRSSDYDGAAIASVADSLPDWDAAGLAFLYHNSANATDRVEAMRITSTGNIGIGITNPSNLLSIRRNSALTTAVVRIGEDGSGDSNLLFANTATGFLIGMDNSDSDKFKIANNGTDLSTNTRLTITTAGNVGLSTDVPNDIFSIGNSGSAPAGSSNTGHNYTNTYLSSDDYALANYGLVKTLISAATSSSALWGGTTGGNIWNLNSANVGIGTTTPAFSFVVSGKADGLNKAVIGNIEVGDWDTGGGYTGYAMIKHRSVNVSNYAFIQDASGNTYFNAAAQLNFGLGANGRLRLETGGSGYIFGPRANNVVDLGTSSLYFAKTYTTNLYTSSNVGIGTSAPGEMLEVNGTIRGGASSVQGSLILAGNYSANQYVNTFGGQYSSAGTVIGYAVRPKPLASGYVSSADNIAWYRAAINLDGGLHVLTGNTQSVAIGGDVAMTEKLTVLNTGNVGVGTVVPNDIFSIGNSGSAPAGSSNTGHNYTNTYLSSDDYALTNYGIVKTLISSATSSLTSLWGGTLGGNIWSLNSMNVGIGTTAPGDKLYVQGNIGLPMSSSTEGIIKLAGYRYIHSFGNTNNTFVGYQSGNTTLTTAAENTFIGAQAGQNLTTGSYNVAIGRGAGAALTTGIMNTLIGRQTGGNITTGSSNTLVGLGAGESWAGSNAIMLGYYAGRWNSAGTGNVILGVAANSYGNANSETVTIGNSSLNSLVNGAYNIALGNYADFISPGAGAGAPAAGTNLGVGIYYYRVSFVLSSGETNSGVLATVTTTAGNQAVNLSSIPVYSGPYNCTARKIYRTPVGVYGRGPYYLVATINDNVTTTYTDTTPDASLSTVLVDNANSILIGSSARALKSNQIILGSTQNEIYLGKGVYSSSPGTISLLATGGMGTNNAGANLTIAAGPGTGSASGGNINFQTAPAGSSGALFNTLFDRMTITSAGNIGIGTSVPNDIFSIGNSGSAPSGSSLTGHNFTSTYLDADNYALANVGYVKSLISAATSTIATSSAVTSLFLTTATSTGSIAYTGGYVGYDAGNQICKAAQTGSHFCRTDEIIYLIQANGAASFAAINNQDAWIADGPPGFTGTVSADDCGGWTDGTNSKLGHFWIYASSGGGRGSLSSCDTIKKISCCK